MHIIANTTLRPVKSVLQQTRRENLRKVIEELGGPTAAGVKLGYTNGSYLVQMVGPHPTRPVTEKTARRYEQTLGLPDGTLDAPEPAVSRPGGWDGVERRESARAGADMPLGRDVIEAVSEVLTPAQLVNSGPEKFSKIMALVYADALEHKAVRREYVQQLAALV